MAPMIYGYEVQSNRGEVEKSFDRGQQGQATQLAKQLTQQRGYGHMVVIKYQDDILCECNPGEDTYFPTNYKSHK